MRFIMKLFLISQDENQDYDTYDSAVVACADEDTARQIDPSNGKPMEWDKSLRAWCFGPDYVTVRYLGEAADDVQQGVVCASFNAG